MTGWQKYGLVGIIVGAVLIGLGLLINVGALVKVGAGLCMGGGIIIFAEASYIVCEKGRRHRP